MGPFDNDRGSTTGRQHDAELMANLHLANGGELACLLSRYTRLVHRVAVSILRDAGEAEDVTQEVFFEVYRKAHLYDPSRGPLKVWLLQYAYHRSLRRRDTLRRRAGYGSEPLDVGEAGCDGHRWTLTCQERRWVIRAALARLPARQRKTLELAWLEELSLRDIAARLRVSIGSARHYYYRGLARLKAWGSTTRCGSGGCAVR